jgi:hypothetical protein
VAVLVGVVLAGLAAMMGRVQRMAVRNVSVMTCLFVIAGFMVSRGFAVMFGCGFVMMGSLMMMIGAFVCHWIRLLFMRILHAVYDMVVKIAVVTEFSWKSYLEVVLGIP